MNKNDPVIIFDFDDLLANSGALHKQAFEETLFAAGVKENIPPELYAGFFGLRILDISTELKRHFGFKMAIEEFVKKRDARFIELVKKGLQLMPGAEGLIRLIRKRGLRRALASSGTREYLEVGLKKLGLADFFEAIASGDEVSKGKPAPDIFLAAAKKLKTLPAKCVVIEDSEAGIKAARNAGMRVIGVKNPFAEVKQDISTAGVIVNSLADIGEEMFTASI